MVAAVGMAWDARSGLKLFSFMVCIICLGGRNGLGSPFGIETTPMHFLTSMEIMSEWPGMPVRD